MDFNTYINMNGYALYVWGAYGVAVLGYIGLMVHALIQYDRAVKSKGA